jgi:type IV secretion system protein VirD4
VAAGFLGGALAAGLLLSGLAGLFGLKDGEFHGLLVLAAGGVGALFAARAGGGAPHSRRDAHGSAAFSAPDQDLADFREPSGLIVGRLLVEAGEAGPPAAPLLRLEGEGHLLTIAPTRSGKGVGALLPNLLLLQRSILCIDPKGENARIAGRARAAMGEVFVLDPFGVSGRPTSAYNPLERLDPTSEDLADEVQGIAEALVADPPHLGGEAHWNEEAKALIAGILLYVATARPAPLRTLTEARRLLTQSACGFTSLLDEMSGSRAAGGLVARAANRHLAKAEREAAGVLSSAQRHTHFLDSARLERVMGRSNFRFEDLKARPCTVFLVLPPERLASHARWLRLMVSEALAALARAGAARPGAPPVLFLLDEFAALGRLEVVAQAFGLMAGYGVQLWAILQDLHQLRAAYGRAAGTFLSNASLLQVFNVADVETAEFVSRALGAATVMAAGAGRSVSRAPGQWFASRSTSTNLGETRRPLLTSDEVMRLPKDRLLLFAPGRPPTLARKVRYFADPEFEGLYEPAAAAAT